MVHFFASINQFRIQKYSEIEQKKRKTNRLFSLMDAVEMGELLRKQVRTLLNEIQQRSQLSFEQLESSGTRSSLLCRHLK